jgi:acetolactate synthase-1/2/3 large subunit
MGFGTHKSILETIRNTDLIVAVVIRFSEIVTQGYASFSIDQAIIHINIDSNTIGKVYNPSIGLVLFRELEKLYGHL